MKIYVITTVQTHENGDTTVAYNKHLFFFKEQAFEESLKLGECACVMEYTYTDAWNFEDIKQQMSEPSSVPS